MRMIYCKIRLAESASGFRRKQLSGSFVRYQDSPIAVNHRAARLNDSTNIDAPYDLP
jgi:hypothetical protein